MSHSIDGSTYKKLCPFSYTLILLEFLLLTVGTSVFAKESFPPTSESSIHVVLYSENDGNIEGYDLTTCTHETLPSDSPVEVWEKSGSLLPQGTVVVLVSPIAFKTVAEQWIAYRISQGYTILALFLESNDALTTLLLLFFHRKLKR